MSGCHQAHHDGQGSQDGRPLPEYGETPLHRGPGGQEALPEIPPRDGPALGRVSEAHRQEEYRLEEGEGHGRGQAERELDEVAAEHSSNKAHGQEDRQEGEGCRDDRAEDLARPLEHGLLEGEAHLPIALDVLGYDDRIVDDYTNCDDQGQEGHEVEGEAHEAVEDRGRRQGDGYGQDDGEGGVGLAEEEEDDDGHDDEGGSQFLPGGFYGGADGSGAVVAHHDPETLREDEGLELGAHGVYDRYGVGVRGTLDRDEDAGNPVDAGIA